MAFTEHGLISSANPGFAGLRCLVLGGGGFIGTHLCNALIRAGAAVQAFGHRQSYPESLDPGVAWSPGEFRDTLALAKAVEGQHFVFHLISGSVPESSNQDPASDLEGNVATTVRLLDLCRAAGVRRIVFASSGGTVYGIPETVPIPETAPANPISAYGIGKLAIEKYLNLYRHLHGLDYVALRMANPYGPLQSAHRRQGVVAALARQALAGEPLEIWGTGDVVRDFLHVNDVIEAMLLAAAHESASRVFNVGSGVGLSINDIARDLETVLGRPLERRYRPARAADVPVNVLDIALIGRELGWRPRTAWLDGLRSTLAWIAGQSAG